MALHIVPAAGVTQLTVVFVQQIVTDRYRLYDKTDVAYSWKILRVAGGGSMQLIAAFRQHGRAEGRCIVSVGRRSGVQTNNIVHFALTTWLF